MKRAFRLWMVTLALFAPGVVHAADDGGTQSVFALGAGNRALGMGGAFVATTDDASAMFWNPAGLGHVSRMELQAAQTGDLSFGASEVYASFAIPSWRWGALGMSFRRFGVGGIESRDERNAVAGDDLSDEEIEMALGYGRRVAQFWSVGAAVKLQKQSLAGFSATGLGLDLGLTVEPFRAAGVVAPWAEGWTLAFAVRNAVEPAIRLDVENVTDPTSIRTGLAYSVPLWAFDQMVAELDVEKPHDAGARIRIGAEYGYRGAAAVRVGMRNGLLTAGTGLHWHHYSVDYAYEDAPLAATHRVGITVPFGVSVDESHAAALSAQDKTLQNRLAEAFQHRQQERITELMQQARAQYAAD
jgi:hypothetical protein